MENILILGSGGREHTFAEQLSKSYQKPTLFIAPGNAGTANIGTNINIDPLDFEVVKQIVIKYHIDMVVVGSEEPLVEGIHDFFVKDKYLSNVSVIGPKKQGAMLEASKEFSKKFMKKYNIPTARYQSFTEESIEQGKAFLETLQAPYVLKADGLAAGKGVIILENLKEAQKELEVMLKGKKFGKASSKVIIETFLKGIELSVFIVTDGKDYKILPSAKDYKRIGEGDTGLNTGGMGAVSPVPFANKIFLEKVEKQIVIPTINGLQEEGIPYKGFIFIGLMNVEGNPYVIEYNVRMGDPETQVILPRIESDLLDLLQGVARGNLSEKKIEITEKTACTVVVVSRGYPENYEKGYLIEGLEKVVESSVFHAGTKITDKGIVSSGGRVMAFTSFSKSISGALEKSYKSIKKVYFKNMNYRRDIGFDL